jgi:hypothetical protein
MGCVKPGAFLEHVEPYSTINYGFALLTQHPNASQVGCGSRGAAGPCPVWDGENIYLADTSKDGSTAVTGRTQWPGATTITDVSPGIISVADVVRLAKMHPSGPKRTKITLGGWSDYARLGNAANGVKAAKLMAKFVAYTFAHGVDIDMEHITPYSRMDDEFGALIAFIAQLREEFKSVADNWSKTANQRISALESQSKAAKNAAQRKWYTVNINHLKEVAALPAPHLEISWTTRFNAFVPSKDYPDRFNYLLPEGGFPEEGKLDFETDNEGTWFWPQVAHIVDTVNIMAYDAGAYDGKPFKLDFAAILDNFAKYGNVPPAKINLGFEPGPQAAGGKWEGQAADEAAAQEMVAKKTSGGAAIWAVNPTPNKYNASVYCPAVAQALKDILKPSYAYGTAPVFTKTSNGWWPTTTEESFII